MASENEQERRETLAEIVAQMRTRSREVKTAFGGRPDGVENMLDIWADRIEAIDSADAWRSLYTPGNAAAMREALANIRKFVGAWQESGLIEKSMAECIFANCARALSAPSRNCDVGTAEEQFKRYLEFCHSESRGCKHCRANMTRLRGTSNCDLAWAQMLYEAQEGAGK